MGNEPSKVTSKIEYCHDLGHRYVYRLEIDPLPIYANSQSSRSRARNLLKAQMQSVIDKIQHDIDNFESIEDEEYFSD